MIKEFDEFKDPMHISDEEFFGKWEDGKVKAPPILRYDKFDGLDNVKKYAESGDYKGAAQKLFDYFKGNRSAPEYKAEINRGSFLAAEMMKEKCFSFLQIDNCVGKAKVTEERSLCTAELSCAANAYFLFDADMNGSAAEICSRKNKAGKAAVLEVETPEKTKIKITAMRKFYM